MDYISIDVPTREWNFFDPKSLLQLQIGYTFGSIFSPDSFVSVTIKRIVQYFFFVFSFYLNHLIHRSIRITINETNNRLTRYTTIEDQTLSHISDLRRKTKHTEASLFSPFTLESRTINNFVRSGGYKFYPIVFPPFYEGINICGTISAKIFNTLLRVRVSRYIL